MLKNGKWLLVLLVLMGAVAVLAACAAPTEKVAAPGEGSPIVLPTRTPLPEGAKPIPGGVYRGYYTSDPSYWDPHMGTVGAHGVWNRVDGSLLQFHFGPGNYGNFDIDTKHSLAESWETSADGLTYTFHLRKGVKWQNIAPLNGRELVAEDVKWTLERHKTTAGGPRRATLDLFVESISCPDKYTVVIKLKQRCADLLLLLANPVMEIMAPELLEHFGTLNKPEAVIGFGPFILDEYVINTRFVYKKNPDYYRASEGLPYLDGIYLVNIVDASTSLAAFRAEKIDIRAISRVDLASVMKTNPHIYCYEQEVSLGGSAVVFRADKLPFSDVNMRRAVSMAIDRQAIIDSQYLGYGLVQVGPIHSLSPLYLADPVKDPAAWGECLKYEQYNPEEAKRLIAEAGYPGGLTITLSHSAGSENAELLNDFLTKAGFKVSMDPLETSAFTSIMYSKHSFPDLGFMTKWGTQNISTIEWLGIYLHTSASNYSSIDDPWMEKMHLAQMAEMDPVKRQEILNEWQRYEICQKYYVHWPLSYGVTCLQPWLRDYAPHACADLTGKIAELMWLTEDAPGRKVK